LKQITKLRRLFNLPPRIALGKTWEIISRRLTPSKKEHEFNSFQINQNWFHKPLSTYFSFPSMETLYVYKDEIKSISENFIKHKFNFLGSGWIHVYLKNNSNKIQSQRISKLIDNNYMPIDWQSDFISGFRWEESLWSKKIKFGQQTGVDIKVPWELGRMQHLPVLSFSAKLHESFPDDFENPEVYKNEFRNQVLDFIAHNPIGYGVHWYNSMEAGIRAANWLLAYDLFVSSGLIFDSEFENIFKQSIFEHGLYIKANLEWSGGMRGNHYLAGITGLLFISAYLPESEKTNAWLAFAIQELCSEILYQFLEYGGNFEASINYHFFSAELVLHSIILISNLPPERIESLIKQYPSKWKANKKLLPLSEQMYSFTENRIIFREKIVERLKSIIRFSLDVAKPKGSVPQIGDNDNGHLFKLIPYEFISNIVQIDNYNNSLKKEIFLNQSSASLIQSLIELTKTEKSDSKYYKDFGIYIKRNENYYFNIRCGSIGQNGKGGHAHNDQLSFELNVFGLDFIVDSGTYCYTSYPEKRNLFRSTKMHNTLYFDGREQNPFSLNSGDDLFWLDKHTSKARCLRQDDSSFIGEHYGYGKPHRRELNFSETQINCADKCETEGRKNVSFHFAPKVEVIKKDNFNFELVQNNFRLKLSCAAEEYEIADYTYSPAYGELQNSKVLILSSSINKIEWQIQIL